MGETIDKAILELRELLTSGMVAEGILVPENYEIRCECCGYVLDYELYDAHEFVSALSLLAALLKNHIVRLDTEGDLI